MKLNLNIPQIAPDEQIMGWVDRICEQNAVHSINEKLDVMNIVFKQDTKINKTGIIQKYFYNLSTFCNTHEDDCLWPNVIDIMKCHTDYYATLPFRTYADQALLAETILSPRTGTIRDVKMRLVPSRDRRYCPLCRQEDGHPIEHVPHQLPGVHVCYKHGVQLQVDGIEVKLSGNLEFEKRVATLMKEIYDDPVFVDYEDIRSHILRNKIDSDMLRKFIERYEIREDIALKLQSVATRVNVRNTDQDVFAIILVFLFHNRKAFAEMIEPSEDEKVAYEAVIKEDYIQKTGYGTLILHECRECGTTFWAHPSSMILKAGCPTCNLKMYAEDIVKRRLKAHGRYMLDDVFKGWEHKYEMINILRGTRVNCSLFKALGDQAYDAEDTYGSFEDVREVTIKLGQWEETVGYENKLKDLQKTISALNGDMEVVEWKKVNGRFRLIMKCTKCGSTEEYGFNSFKERPYCRVCSGKAIGIHTQATIERALREAGLSVKPNSFYRKNENIYVNIKCPSCRAKYNVHMGYLKKIKKCKFCGKPL